MAFTGFPLRSRRPVTSKGIIASYNARLQQVFIDKVAWPGASGSPLYVASGQVVGMVHKRGIGAVEGLAFARPAVLIRDFLAGHKIPMEGAE